LEKAQNSPTTKTSVATTLLENQITICRQNDRLQLQIDIEKSLKNLTVDFCSVSESQSYTQNATTENLLNEVNFIEFEQQTLFSKKKKKKQNGKEHV